MSTHERRHVFVTTFLVLAFGLATGGPVGGSAPGSRGTHDGTVPGGYPGADGEAVAAAARGNPHRPTGPIAGLGRTALSFDGNDDYVLIRNFAGLPTKTMTAAAWICVTQHKSYNRILSHKWVGNGWNLFTDGSGVARFGVGQDNSDFAASKIIFRNLPWV